MMKAIASRHVLAAALAAASILAVSVPASAWTRNSAVTTPRGTYTSSGSGSCAHGSGCQRSSTTTGPYGGTVNHQGYAYGAGNGSVNYGGTTTGPYGGAVSRSGTVTRY